MCRASIVPERGHRPRARRVLPVSAVCALLLLMLYALQGCATAPGTSAHGNASPAELLEQGREALTTGRPDQGVDAFRRLEVLYPQDPLAVTARMELVFAYHQAGDASAAIASAERFVRLYPDHPNLDYLYYLRGLAAFNRAKADLESTAAGDAALRATRPPSAEVALQYLAELIARFPDSRYAEDGRSRVAHLRQQLARIELEAAQQLMNQGQYASAALRARALIENYPESTLLREAAVIVNMAHRMLNMGGAAASDAGRETGPGKVAGEAAVTPQAVTPAPPPETPPPEATARETTQATSVEAAVASAVRADGLRREDWIAAQNPAAYTIQLFSTSKEEALLAFVKRHRLTEAAYFRSGPPERRWHSLIHGVYATIDEARAAAERLPASLRGERPWIRRISDLHALGVGAADDNRPD